jgi:hypothetical protein
VKGSEGQHYNDEALLAPDCCCGCYSALYDSYLSRNPEFMCKLLDGKFKTEQD